MDKAESPKVTTIALAPALFRRLKIAALDDGRPASDLIRDAITEYLDRRDKRGKGRAQR